MSSVVKECRFAGVDFLVLSRSGIFLRCHFNGDISTTNSAEVSNLLGRKRRVCLGCLDGNFNHPECPACQLVERKYYSFSRSAW